MTSLVDELRSLGPERGLYVGDRAAHEIESLVNMLEPLALCQLGGSMEGDPACCAGCFARFWLDTRGAA